MTNVVINRDVVDDLHRKLGHLETHNSSDAQKLKEVKESIEVMQQAVYTSDRPDSRSLHIPLDTFIQMNATAVKAEYIKERFIDAMVNLYSVIDDDDQSDVPMLSEGFLYERIGKEATRSLLWKIEQLSVAVGLDHYNDVERVVCKKFNDAARYTYRVKFKTDQAAIDFSKERTVMIRETCDDGDEVPRCVFPLQTVVVDPPEERELNGTTQMVSSERIKITNERNILNITSKFHAWFIERFDQDDVEIIDKSMHYAMD
jgi:hypothetical protein